MEMLTSIWEACVQRNALGGQPNITMARKSYIWIQIIHLEPWNGSSYGMAGKREEIKK